MARFSNSDEFEAWLPGKLANSIAVITLRLALRLVPLLSGAAQPAAERRPHAPSYILPVMRANAFAFAAAHYPDKATEIRAGNVGNAEYAAVKTPRLPAIAAFSALFAADAAIGSNGANDRANSAYAGVYAGRAARATDRVDGPLKAEFWRQLSDDTTALDQGAAPATLAGTALWNGDIPAGVTDLWGELAGQLGGFGQDWTVWINWFEARLAGRTTAALEADQAEMIDIRLATRNGSWWQRDPGVVNGDIRDWIDEARGQ